MRDGAIFFLVTTLLHSHFLFYLITGRASSSNLFFFGMLYSIVRWLSGPRRARVAAPNRSQGQRTVVRNMSDLQLTIIAYYLYMEAEGGSDYYGSVEFKIPVGTRTTIRSGNFVREYLAFRDYQEIHVLGGGRVLHAMRDDHFHDNIGMDLLLDMQDGLLRYAFLDPRQHINHADWNWGVPPVRDAAP